MRNVFHKLAYKMAASVGTTTILAIGVFAYINIQSHTRDLLTQVEQHLNQVSETVKYSTKYDMLLNQRDHIHQVINTIGEQHDIDAVRVLNKLGEIIYSSRQEDIGKAVDKKAESCYACHAENKPLERLPIKDRTRIYQTGPGESRRMGIINPIYNEPACWSAACHAHPQNKKVLGLLDVTIPLQTVDLHIRQAKREIVVFAFAAMLAICGVIVWFSRRWIDRPVNQLLKATQNVASGNLHSTILHYRNDEIGDLAQSFNNMTKKLSEARMQLFQSDKLASLGRLAAGVAHEINNPLTGVLTYSSFLLKKTADRPEIQEDLKVIVRETKRCREIVKSLLDFSRQSVPRKSGADLSTVIDQAVAVVENQLALKKIEIFRKYDPQLPKLTIDASQIQQVFINLIVNAADAFEDKPGRITISTAFLKLAPHGNIHVRGAVCPRRHSLMDNEIRIDGLPSIKLKILGGKREGMVFLDPVYGRKRHRLEFAPDLGPASQFVCPECGASLLLAGKRNTAPDLPIFGFDIPSQGQYEGAVGADFSWEKWDAVDKQGPRENAEIAVQDNGKGIAREDLAKIFEPFFSTKGVKGNGLGLAVTWGIIDNHDGTIGVQSEINKGTTFTIRLPVTAGR